MEAGRFSSHKTHMSEPTPVPSTRDSLLELLRRSQHLKDEAARLLTESRDLDKLIEAQAKMLSDQLARSDAERRQN